MKTPKIQFKAGEKVLLYSQNYPQLRIATIIEIKEIEIIKLTTKKSTQKKTYYTLGCKENNTKFIGTYNIKEIYKYNQTNKQKLEKLTIKEIKRKITNLEKNQIESIKYYKKELTKLKSQLIKITT